MTIRAGFTAITMIICASSLGGCSSSLGNGFEQTDISSGSVVPARAQEESSNSTELTRPVATNTAAGTPGSTGYRIGPLDVLDVSVFQVPELTRSVQVSDVGTVNLPLVGEVAAAGKTSREIERAVASRLGAKYVRAPQVTVFVKEYNSQRVTVEGAVKKPGVYPTKGHDTLTQFVAIAEGIDRETASSTVVVFRTIDGKRYAAKFDIKEIMAGRAEDPPIQPNDIIAVDSSSGKEVFSYVVKLLPAAALFTLL